MNTGKFRATLHRVVDKTYGRHERYSVPFFYETNIDTVIEPLVEDCQEIAFEFGKNLFSNLYNHERPLIKGFVHKREGKQKAMGLEQNEGFEAVFVCAPA